MAGDAGSAGSRPASVWRLLGWSAAGALLVLPLVAMQLTDEVDWGVEDFLCAVVLVGGVGGAFELAVRKTASPAYQAAVGVALAAGFILVWSNLAVGIIESEGNPANLMFFGVPAVAMLGALAAWFRPGGMARALVATALAQVLAALVALLCGWGFPGDHRLLRGLVARFGLAVPEGGTGRAARRAVHDLIWHEAPEPIRNNPWRPCGRPAARF